MTDDPHPPVSTLDRLRSCDFARPLVESVGPAAHEVLQEAFAGSAMLPIQELTILANAVRAIEPKRTLEIGLASGASAITIMSARSPGGDRHIALDPLQQSQFGGQAVERIKRLGLASEFKMAESFSYVLLPLLWIKHAARFDFIFIDASHMFDQTMIEWFYADKLIDVGGVIGFDDCHFPMVQAVVNFVETNCPYTVIKPSERTWFAVKTDKDQRQWFDFQPFEVPFRPEHQALLESMRR